MNLAQQSVVLVEVANLCQLASDVHLARTTASRRTLGRRIAACRAQVAAVDAMIPEPPATAARPVDPITLANLNRVAESLQARVAQVAGR
jgi:hypothetical protein